MMDLSSLPRLPGWESRLPEVIEAARCRAYVLGEHDCFRLACTVMQTLVGIDRWPWFAGQYTTRRECLALMAEHGHNFTEAASWFFGSAPVGWQLARRGDILEYREPATSVQAGWAHLVVLVGGSAAHNCAGLTESGLVFVPAHACANAWRIG